MTYDYNRQRTAGTDKAAMDSDQRELYDDLYLIASNDGNAYKKKDAKGAIDKAFREHMKNVQDNLRGDFKAIQKILEKDLASRWSES